MHNQYARAPSFGGQHRSADYYENINNIIRLLLPMSTYRLIAAHLNAQGFTTPSGMEFTRARLSNYIQSNFK